MQGYLVQVCVPEFKAVDFRVVKKRRCVVSIVGGYYKQNEPAQGVGENLRGPYPGGEWHCPARDWQ